MAKYFEALKSLSPDNAVFGIENNDLTTIVWGDGQGGWTSVWPDNAPSIEDIKNKAAELTAEEPWKLLRAERDRRLAECDWVVTRAVDLSNDGLGIQLEQVWVDYRKALRDLPANTIDPANPVWPVKPSTN